jgi:hypothetical protein
MNALLRWGLVAIIVAGLVIDAVVHFELASNYPYQPSGSISEETLFRIEAVLAILAAAFVVARPGWLSAIVAVAVAGGGLAVLVLYRYVDVGKIGPVPSSLYEPYWYGKKISSVVGQAMATLGGLALAGAEFRVRHGNRSADGVRESRHTRRGSAAGTP